GESYAPREILEENRLIHHRLGFEGSEEFSVMVGGLEAYGPESPNSLRSHGPIFDTPIMLTFKPDTFRDDIIYELKILRPYSDRDRLLMHAFLQIQLELYALGIERGRILLHSLAENKTSELEVTMDPEVAERLIDYFLELRRRRDELQKWLVERMPSPRRRELGT
ncbi:MAG: hypothetical protein QXZ17_13965, partial [Nitrososphaerota archaeon]